MGNQTVCEASINKLSIPTAKTARGAKVAFVFVTLSDSSRISALGYA